MKLILLIAFIFVAIASSKVIEIKKTRNVGYETLALELDYYGSCREFKDRVLPTVWVSTQQTCLPIQVNVTYNPDNDDLNAHFFCSNVDDHRSRIHFVEVYSGTDESVAFPNFVLSLVPSAPLRVFTREVSLARRPNCWVTNDYCEEGTNAVVNRCEDNFVVYRRRNGDVVERPHHEEGRPGQEGGRPGQGRPGRRVNEFSNEDRFDDDLFVASHDRVYFTANKAFSRECRSSERVCCPYIKPHIFGGICNHEAPQELNDFWREPHHDDDDHRHHEEEEHRHHDDEEHRHHHNYDDGEEKKRSN